MRAIASGSPRELRLERLARGEQVAAVVVEAGADGVRERAELVPVAVHRQHGEPRLRRPQRQLLAAPVDPGGQDPVLQLVLARGQLARDDPGLAGLAEPVEALALVAVRGLLGLAQDVELPVREEVAVALDDRRLLGDLLLADADGAPLLRALEEVARQALLVLDRRPHPRHAHVRRAYRTTVPATAAVSRFSSNGLPRTRVDAGPQLGADLARPRQEHDARRQLERRDLVEQLEPVVGADVDVEQDHVRRRALDLPPRLGDGARLTDVVAVELEVDPAEQAERALVVDHEHVLDVPPPWIAHQARALYPASRTARR